MVKYDVLSYIENLGIEYKEKGKNVGKEWIGLKCPNCGDDPDFHLGVHKEHGTFNCWRCGITGNFVQLVKLLEDVSTSEALSIAREYALIERKNNSYVRRRKLKLPDYCFPFWSLNGNPIGRKALKYLEKRRFSFSDVKDFYYCVGGKFAGRIIIPIYRNGELVNYIGRSFDGREPRYLNCPNSEAIVPLSQLIYKVNIINNEFLVIVEGVFDALRIGINSIAVFGKKPALSKHQLDEIKKISPKRIFIFYDEDAVLESSQLAEFLLLYLPNTKIYKVIPDAGKDPADMDRKTILKNIYGVLQNGRNY